MYLAVSIGFTLWYVCVFIYSTWRRWYVISFISLVKIVMISLLISTGKICNLIVLH